MNNMTRETYRNIKKYDYKQMNAFCAKLYQQGFLNGINAEPDIEYKCGNCGKDLYRTDYKFCPYCGAELIWNEEEGEENDNKKTNDRNCNLCVFHLKGSCSRWECEGTITERMVSEMLEERKTENEQ